MHLILLTRGINSAIEQWKMFMQAQMFNWKRYPLLKDDNGQLIKNADGTYKRSETPEYTRVQGALRPIQLWEYVFPQESLQEVLAMQEMHKDYNNLRPEVARLAWLLRKGTGAKKIPDMPDLKNKDSHMITQKFVAMDGVACYPIGIREDHVRDHANFGYYQEGL